ncbi:MAG TPA: hypothetical protein VJX66_21395 [Amycolatopsis sp.]|nr:hypothetical protein [Amycolatopsis sp.]
MELEWMVSAVLIAVASSAFGHFEAGTPTPRRLIRWLLYLAITFALGHTVGRPWTWVWIAGLPLIGAGFHIWWCRRNGINPLTAQPRDRYHALRGWTTK